jgi:hypothetical protein
MRSDNSIHLTTAAKRRHELTRAKAIAALHDLDRAGAKITFEAVADHALLTELRGGSPHVNGVVVVSGATVCARDRRE